MTHITDQLVYNSTLEHSVRECYASAYIFAYIQGSMGCAVRLAEGNTALAQAQRDATRNALEQVKLDMAIGDMLSYDDLNKIFS